MKYIFTIFVNNVEFRKVRVPKSIANKSDAISYARDWIARKELKKVPRVMVILEMISPAETKHTQWAYSTSETLPPVEKENLIV